MAIAYVQGTSVLDTSSASVALAYTSNVTANGLLVLGARLSDIGRTITVTDSQGNTWAEVVAGGKPDGNGSMLYMYWAKAGSSGANTVTFAYSGAVDFLRVAIHEVSGMTTPALDQTANASGSSAAPASGNVTTTHADEFLFACSCYSGICTVTPGSGWTQKQVVSSGANARYSDEIRIETGTGTLNGNFSIDTSRIWAAIIATFYDSAGGGATGTIASTLQKATSSFTGSHKQTGTIAATAAKATSSFTGVMNPSGSFASIMRKSTAAFFGTQTQTGSIASILTKTTSAFSGSVGSGVLGSITSTLQRATSAWTGLQKQTGTITSTLQKATASLTGVMNPSGTIASRITKATASFTGTQTITGTIASTLTKATSSFTGTKSYLGTIASIMTKATSSFTGTHKQTGVIASSMRVLTSAWTGAQPFTGTFASILTKATALFTAYNREPSYTALSRIILEIPRYNAVLEMTTYNLLLYIPKNNEVLNGN